MNRLKTYDATGIAPNGKLFAGDMNALQDAVAALYDLAQAQGFSSAAIGEAGLILSRYAVGEARLSGALRADGIMRGLGGLFAGTFTTAQRDGITAGLRPYGLVILNSTTNRLEINLGTDPSPNWQPVGSTADVPVGAVMDWPWAAASIPSWAVLPVGQGITSVSHPALHALAVAAGYVYGGSGTNSNLPDYRGRLGVGKDDMGGSAASRVTVGVSGINGATLGAVGGAQGVALATADLPAHNHGVTGAPTVGTLAVTGAPALGTLSISGAPSVGSLSLPNHVHDPFGAGDFVNYETVGPVRGGADGTDMTRHSTTGYPPTLPGINGAPGLGSLAVGGTPGVGTLGVGGAPGVGTLGTSNTGGGGTHQNMPPCVVVNKIMRAL